MSSQPEDFLKSIKAQKAKEVAELKRSGASAMFIRQSLVMPLPPSFHDSLRVPKRRFAIIGEVKRSSPSVGAINLELDPATQAAAYEAAGLSAVSVLTDQTHFGGSPQDMLAAAQTTTLPVLCKDFIIDPVQVYRARAFGASAVLLICALLDDDQLWALVQLTRKLSLDPFVETHSADEIERALALGVRVIGVNARNLKTLKVDLNTTRRLNFTPRVIPWKSPLEMVR